MGDAETGPQPAPVPGQPAGSTNALGLLRRPGFRRTYLAIAVSELGDAFQYVALMWFALLAGGPLGVIAVRLADSVPALVFGLHGGLMADRLERRRTMIGADLVRGAVLVPVAVLGLTGDLTLWMLVPAAFVVETATSYFAPAYGALLPSLVDRRNVQAANGLVRATTEAVHVGGWAGAAALLVFLPVSALFAFNAASFFVSALLLTGVAVRGRALGAAGEAPSVRAGFAALRPQPVLAAGIAALGVGVTISAGTWIVGVPELVRSTLGLGAGSFSLAAASYAVGAAASGVVLSRRPVRRKARASLLAWSLYLPAYGAFALAGSLPLALVGAALAGAGQGAALVLLYSAAQEDVPDTVLGRVIGLVALTHRGAHATGLLLVSPLFALAAPEAIFAAAALVLPLVGIAALAASRRPVISSARSG